MWHLVLMCCVAVCGSSPSWYVVCGSSPSWSVVCGSRLCADKSVVVCGVRIKTACGSSPADRGYIHGLKAVIFVAQKSLRRTFQSPL